MNSPISANMPGAGGAEIPGVAIPVGSSSPDEPPVGARAVEEARREIQTLVREIAELAKSDVPPDEFYEVMLTRMVAALAAVGGAIWLVDEDKRLSLAYQVNLTDPDLIDGEQRRAQHARLLEHVLESGDNKLMPPHSGGGGDDPVANPTDHLLILGTVDTDDGARGIVEIFQRADTRPATQRGFLRFVGQMCELAADYFKSRRLRHFTHKESLWEQLDQFTDAVHRKLSVRHVAYTAANDGRSLIGCDRVSLMVRQGRKYRVAAISGQDTFDPRSNLIVRLRDVARRAAATGEPLWYSGDTSDLPPQVEKAIDAYVDLSHARMVSVVPLSLPGTDEKEPKPGDILGALVVEQMGDSQIQPELKRRVAAVARHTATALSAAREHENLFLMPLWRVLGRLQCFTTAGMLPRTLAALCACAAVVAALVMVPADFELEARGVLQPSVRRDVFAEIDGVVLEVPVKHGQRVAAGDVLARMQNTDLEVEVTDVLGRREATMKQMRSIERALLGENRLTVEEQNRMSGQLLELKKTYESLDLQLGLYRQKQALLTIASKIDGQVVTWQVGQRLMRRPVRRGQVLMNVADPDGEWELEVHLPEDHMGHLARAMQSDNSPRQVNYILATRPGETHVGQIEEVHASAEVHGDEGNTVRLRVAIDKHDLADLRPGSTVIARVDCGRRSIGYVWLHDLFAFVQSKILFRL